MTLAELLEEARRREKAQTMLYRALAADAHGTGADDWSERVNGLLADEQHHLSRLTARLLELGEEPRSLGADTQTPALEPAVGPDAWEARVLEREAAEVAFYEKALARDLDAETRAIFEEILAAERHHLQHLGGKWMSA